MRDSASLRSISKRKPAAWVALALSLSCAAAPPSEPAVPDPAASVVEPTEPSSAASPEEGSSFPAPEPSASASSPPGAAESAPGSAPAAEVRAAAAAPSPAGTGATDMLGFIGIGRGERVAELGAVTRDSVELMVQAVGPAGVVYVRHDPRTLTALPSTRESAKPTDALPPNVVLMTTRDEAVLDAAVKDLNVATLLFSYHDLVARGVDRRRLNLAVYRALVPSGTYVVADLAPPPGTSAEAARKLNRVGELLVRSEVEAAGFVLADSAELVTNTARGESDANEHGSQYILKFRKAR